VAILLASGETLSDVQGQLGEGTMTETAPQVTYHEPTFRTHPAEWVNGDHGEEVLLQLCEELIDGRWEPFVATLWARPRPLDPVDAPTA
jgi:hypothetical protein